MLSINIPTGDDKATPDESTLQFSWNGNRLLLTIGNIFTPVVIHPIPSELSS